MVIGGDGAAGALAQNGHAVEFLKNQYRHCKPILLLGAARDLLERAGIPGTLPSGADDAGLLLHHADDTGRRGAGIIAAVAKHRHFEREIDPPLV